MNSKLWISSVLLLLLIGVAVILRQPDPEGISRRNPDSMHAHQKEWPVSCEHGAGKLQSPIHVSAGSVDSPRSQSMKVQILNSQADLFDVGYTFQVRYNAGHPGATTHFENKDYDLRQFHFHKPSEHLIDGKQYEMEAHFVFFNRLGSEKSKALVLSVMILDGARNSEIGRIWKHLPPMREGYGESKVEMSDWKQGLAQSELDFSKGHSQDKKLAENLQFNLSRLVPTRADFIVYEGSLTTPDCAEGITHAIALTPIYFEHEQVEHFEGYYEGSNRDLQAIGDLSQRKFRRARLDLVGGY